MLSQKSAHHRNFTEHNLIRALARTLFLLGDLKNPTRIHLAQEASRLEKLLHVFVVFNLLALESAHLWCCLANWNVVLGCGILQGCSVIENHKATEGPSQGLNAIEDVEVLLASMQNMLQLSNYPYLSIIPMKAADQIR